MNNHHEYISVYTADINYVSLFQKLFEVVIYC